MRPTTQMSDCRAAAVGVARGPRPLKNSPDTLQFGHVATRRSVSSSARGSNSSAGRPAGRQRGVEPSADFKCCGKVNSACVPRPGVARAHVGGRAARPRPNGKMLFGGLSKSRRNRAGSEVDFRRPPRSDWDAFWCSRKRVTCTATPCACETRPPPPLAAVGSPWIPLATRPQQTVGRW